MPAKPKTIKELKEQRRKENFVGRTEQQQVFTENFAGDEPKWVVLSVTGEGGVGKSTLLKRYTQLAQGDEINANVVYCDDHQYTPVDAMAVIAEQLEKLGIESKKFNERYKKYRETLQQIESDPTAPRGMVNVVTRGLTDFTIKSLRRLPGVGVAADYMDEKAAGDAMADLAQYAFTRWGNKDEVLLVREPEKILTPLFVELLNEATQKQRLVVMFDVFERTASTLSSWIIELVDGRHGDFSSWVSFIVSGRDPLEQHWTELAGLMSHVQLEPFTLDETAVYLSNQDIKDETLVKQIHEDTGGLPVLVELLASTKPQSGIPLPDISKDAVERFLQWTPDEAKRHAALIASAPRQFNQEILQAVLGQDKGKELFHWLAGQSFVRSNTERGYFYHDKVRGLMLRYQKNITPGELSATHAALAEHFAKTQAEFELQGNEAYENQAWRKSELERIYHHVSAEPEKHFVNALDSFLAAFLYRLKFSQTVVRTGAQAMADNQCDLFDENLGKLDQLVDFYDKHDYQQIMGLISEVQNAKGISNTSYSICFFYKGFVNFSLSQYEDALADFSCAIEMDEKYTKSIALKFRGGTYRLMKRYEEAVADFSHAIELDKKNAAVMALRGETYQSMKRYEEALADSSRAIELDEKYTWSITNRGITYQSMKRYEEALTDFTRAIEVDGKSTRAITNRGETYRLMERYEEALADFTRAIEVDGKSTWAITNRGEIYRLMDRYEEALADFTRAIEMDEKYMWAIASRGQTYQSMKRYEEALTDFTRRIELDGKSTWAITNRGETYRLMDRYEEALADFTRAIEMDEKYMWAITNRGITYQSMKRYEEALTDFTRAIELDEKYTWAITNRGQTYQSMNRYEEALTDFTRAIELNEKYDWAIANRGQTYRLMERYEEALADFTRAIELDEKDLWRYYQRGNIYRLLKQYEKALSDLNTVISNGMPDAGDYATRAAIYLALREQELSQKDIEKALSLETKKPGEHYGYALALIMDKNLTEAVAELELDLTDSIYQRLLLIDDRLDPIRGLPEFKALLAKYQ